MPFLSAEVWEWPYKCLHDQISMKEGTIRWDRSNPGQPACQGDTDLTELLRDVQNEPRHDKTNKMNVRPAKTQISLSIRPV